MNKVYAIWIMLIIGINGIAQENGSPILKVYADFYKGLTEDDASTAFEVTRVYLGYKGDISENFYAEAKLDIGSPEDQSQYSLIRRYAYFKTAYVKYHKDGLNIFFGLTDMMQFKAQEKNWGYRYISKSFMDEYKYGPSADIGIGLCYQFSDFISADLMISNGEGYKNLQSDNSYKTALGISFFPLDGLIVRFYYDFMKKDITQSVFASYIGYKNERFRIGAEYDLMFNKSNIEDQDQYGFSVYSTYSFTEKWSVFGRYDRLNSNILFNEEQPWNIYKDGTALTTGVEFSPVKNINCSLNYQDWYSYAANGADKKYIYLNVEFKL
jgi:opacity protein-like surface antigen